MPKNATPAGGTAGAGDAVQCVATHSQDTPAGRICQTTTPRHLLANALRYALAGWRVLPLCPGEKNPLTAHGVHDSSTDPEVIGEWWARWPNANVGLAIGDEMVVFDVDPRNGGDVAHLAKVGVDASQAPTQHTAGGGLHVVYRKPLSIDLAAHVKDLPGLDVISGARYIVAEPSVVNGRSYRWERHPLDVEPPRLPLDVAERLRKRAPAAPAPTQRAASAPTPAGDAPPLHVLEHALAHLDPWAGGYDWWVGLLMAIHSAYPDADGLALAEAWGQGQPGEIARKWTGFDVAGGITYGLILREAKARGWRPDLAGDEAPTMDTAHRALHSQMERLAGGASCPICGRSFFETAVVGHEVRSRRRVMMCHKRDCLTWQTHKAERQIMERRPWEWAAWFVTEHGPDEWRALINGKLSQRGDWIAAPLINGNIALFAGFTARAGAVSVSLTNLLEMAAERILAIPAGKRLRKPKDKARAKRAASETAIDAPGPEPVEEPRERLRWTRWAFGIDLLSVTEAWSVLAVMERAGATVEADSSARWPLSIDQKVRKAVAAWIRPERQEIDAYTPVAENASISAPAPLPEQAGYRAMPERQRRHARLLLLEDTERAYRQRESLTRA